MPPKHAPMPARLRSNGLTLRDDPLVVQTPAPLSSWLRVSVLLQGTRRQTRRQLLSLSQPRVSRSIRLWPTRTKPQRIVRTYDASNGVRDT